MKNASAQLYEADSGSGKILEFTSTGVQSAFASGLNQPTGLAFDPSGDLFVSEPASGIILKFTPGGVESTFASGLSEPTGLAFDAGGNLFVAAPGSGKILKFTPAAVKSTFASGLNHPSCLAFDAFGNLFAGSSTGAAGGGHIVKFTPSGTKTTFASGLFSPTSLAFDARGNLYAADKGNAHIYKFTPAGTKSSFASGSTFGLAFDAFGDAFSSDDSGNIFVFPAGGVETTFATGLDQSGMLAFAPFTTLDTLSNPAASNPNGGLVQATNGLLYGTTSGGGTSLGFGTIFAITPSGIGATLYNFCSRQGCVDGTYPIAALVQATNGNLYGTTSQGGAHGSFSGTVFKITPAGTLTTLYSFCAESNCTDGENPEAGLVQAANGDLYGTTFNGGTYNGGTVFKIAPNGKLTSLYSFCSQKGCPDGRLPQAGLIQATDGDLYGTTSAGGANGNGAVYKISPSGILTTLYSFCAQPGCADGEQPEASLIQGADGNFYGTTTYGGNAFGTVFKMTPGGTLTTLHKFCSAINCADGEYPQAALVQASNGDLYGTTSGVSDGFHASIFKITPSGVFTPLYSFCPGNTECQTLDGPAPIAGLLLDTNGDFYGTGSGLGVNNNGTIFKLSVGLPAFVKTLPTSGQTGEAVKILGTNLNGASSVTFNGIAATFTVDSSSEISTTVPTGATTGQVQVVTPGGTLESNVPFTVSP